MARSQSLISLAPAAGLLLVSLLLTGGLTVWPHAGQPVAAIFPLSADRSAAFAAASAAGAESVLAFGGWTSVILAQSSDPDFIDHLYHAGAIMVLRAPQTTGCMH